MGILLLILVLWCRHSVPAADCYAAHLYPYISAALSWLAAPFGFSLTELVVVAAVVVFIGMIIRAFRRHWGFWKGLWRIALFLIWIYVWFYGAWALNYSRSDIYARIGTVPSHYEETDFQEFLGVLAEELNEHWQPVETVDSAAVERHVKAWYASLPAEAGLCQPRSWQHPKRLTFNRLQSAVGVLGFVGPFFDEMQLNSDMTPLEYPFVFAHEYAHVLGVSGEAEANFWAFEASRASDDPAVRYSAWYMLLTYSWRNIQSLLGEEAFLAWTGTLRPEILEDLQRTQEHWESLRWTALARAQKRFYNFFLRSNRIADGTKNYGEVLRLVLTFSDWHEHDHGEEE